MLTVQNGSICPSAQRPSPKIYGSSCDHSDARRIEGADGRQTALTSNRIIQGWLRASRVLFLDLFKDFFFIFYFFLSRTLKWGPKVIFTLMTCSPEIKTPSQARGCCHDYTGSMTKMCEKDFFFFQSGNTSHTSGIGKLWFHPVMNKTLKFQSFCSVVEFPPMSAGKREALHNILIKVTFVMADD